MRYFAHPHLHRSRRDRVFTGLCGGIAERFDFSPLGTRLLCLLLIFLTWPITLPAYIILSIMVPLEPLGVSWPGEEGDVFDRGRVSRAEMLTRLEEQFDTLDKRLQRMESVVTRPGFDVEQEYRNLREP
ncbi:MAG: PspC domain-containing protein [Candidatus Sumerlaeota bacterium]|nr:PspC domain-containing protein [Candidatus Sumerlaeota bacterium]